MAELLANYGRHVDDLRAALDWAFSSKGDAALGLTLTTAAAPLWMHLSLLEECRSRVERALAGFAVSVTGDKRGEMKLQAALGASLTFSGGAVSAIKAALARALHLAESLGDIDQPIAHARRPLAIQGTLTR
jgi:hypothetical protein